MSTLATERLLVGRRVVGFALNPFKDGRGGTAYDPIIRLDNGATLRIVVTETEAGEYGAKPIYIPRDRSAPVVESRPCEFCNDTGVVPVKDPCPIPVTADCPEGCPR